MQIPKSIGDNLPLILGAALGALLLIVLLVALLRGRSRRKTGRGVSETPAVPVSAPRKPAATMPLPPAEAGPAGVVSESTPPGLEAASAPTAPSMPRGGLALIEASGKSWALEPLPATIGRQAENRVVLSGEAVSAVHARIYFDEMLKAICIEDLDSLNGLFIEELPTRKNILQDGMRVRLGEATLTFHSPGHSPAGAR